MSSVVVSNIDLSTSETKESSVGSLGKRGEKRKRTLKEHEKLFCNADNKGRCTSRKRRRKDDCNSKEIENIKGNGTQNPSEKDSKEEKDQIDQEQVVLKKQNWRSRCGRKRKYFGQASARQGATSRERNRFQGMKKALEALKQLIPNAQKPTYGKLSKYATLKLAARYIAVLTDALQSIKKMEGDCRSERHRPVCSQGSEESETTNRVFRLDEDELFTGDFSDIMFDDCDKDESFLFNEIPEESFELTEKEGIESLSPFVS